MTLPVNVALSTAESTLKAKLSGPAQLSPTIVGVVKVFRVTPISVATTGCLVRDTEPVGTATATVTWSTNMPSCVTVQTAFGGVNAKVESCALAVMK
jgi:hypothetical protein